MARTKRKKPVGTRGGATTTAPRTKERNPSAVRPVEEAGLSNRRLKKEQARRERERRMRTLRRRRLLRRIARWVIPLVIIAGLAAFFVVRNIQSSRRAALAAGDASCGEISTEPDQRAGHTAPFVEGANGIPASVGSHSSPLQPDPRVYDQPVPEANAVHNLEHGYVLIYYRAEGDSPLDAAVTSRLEEVASAEDKVIMAPYSGLASKLALVGWRQVQLCDPSASVADQAEVVAQHFIDEHRGGGLAPEPAAP